MSSEIQKIGDLFRIRREEMRLTLKECENSISIRSNFLKAIEEGKINELISGIYASGFTKQYASFLGIDIDSIKKESPKAFAFQPQAHDFSYGIGTLETRGSLGGGIKWLPNVLWAGFAGVMIVLAYYFARAIGVL